MEALSKLLYKACEAGLLEGFHVGIHRSRDLLVSHLLFADDTLIFCRPCESDLGYLRCVLLLFEAMSGLKVNLSKSSLIPIGEIPNIQQLASFFDCGVSALPSMYLGLPLGASFKSKAVWDPVVERFQKRLAGWKSKMLSKGGRLTLLQSTLWNLPIYYMFLFTIPMSVACQLERLMRDFYGLSMIVTEGFIGLSGMSLLSKGQWWFGNQTASNYE